MKIEDNFIKSTLETWYQSNKSLILEIHNRDKCLNCAGDLEECTCRYCGTKNVELEMLLKKLEVELLKWEQLISNYKVTDISNNKFFDMLILLKDRNIDFVNNFLNKYNYVDKYQAMYESSFNKMKEDKELSEQELHAMEIKILSHEDPKSLMNIYNYYIASALLKKQNVSYETFKVLIKKFSEVSMSEMYNGFLRPLCIITNDISEKGGDSFFNMIRIREDDIRDLYDGNGFAALFTIAHEMKHAAQYRKIFIDKDLVMQTGNIEEMVEDHKFLMDKIKEFAIFDYDKDYYKKNYNNVSFEVEAEIHGINETLRYIKTLGLTLSDNSLSYWTDKVEQLENNKNNKERIMNGEVTTLDNVFDSIIVDHPGILSKYKQLNLLYKIVNNKVVAKDENDKRRDLDAFLNHPNATLENKAFFEEIYKLYLNSARDF